MQALVPALIRILILTGQTDPSHDWRLSTPYLRQALAATGRFQVEVTEDPRALTSGTLAGFDALLLHYNGPRWGAPAEKAVEEFLRSGKGMVAFHGVSYGPFYGLVNLKGKWEPAPEPAWPAYAAMMGSTWAPGNIGHGARHAFPVKWVDREHPIARGMEETFTAHDELYHKMDLLPNAHVLATAYSDPARRGTGRDEPMVWTVPFSRGRVVHITLGHDLCSMSQTGFLTTLARSLEWTATGAVTLGPRLTAAPQPCPR